MDQAHFLFLRVWYLVGLQSSLMSLSPCEQGQRQLAAELTAEEGLGGSWGGRTWRTTSRSQIFLQERGTWQDRSPGDSAGVCGGVGG